VTPEGLAQIVATIAKLRKDQAEAKGSADQMHVMGSDVEAVQRLGVQSAGRSNR